MALKSIECALCDRPQANCQLRLGERFFGMGCRRCSQMLNIMGSEMVLFRLLAKM